MKLDKIDLWFLNDHSFPPENDFSNFGAINCGSLVVGKQ